VIKIKKLILFISIFGLLILTSCNGGTDNTSNSSYSSNNTPSTIEPTNNSNEPTQNDGTTSNDNSNTSNTGSSTNTENVYDDGIDWGPLH